MQNILLDVFTKMNSEKKNRKKIFTKCILCTHSKIKKWQTILEKTDFKVVYIQKLDDFELITFSFLHTEKSILLCTVECIKNLAEELDQSFEDVRVGIQDIVEQNSFVSVKNIPFHHEIGLTFELAKKIFMAQENKFPQKSVPFQWIDFDAVIYDISEQSCVAESYNTCFSEENNFIFEIVKGNWNFVCLPLDGQAFTNQNNFYLNPNFLSQIPSHVFFDDLHLKWNNYKFSNMFVLQLWSTYFLHQSTIIIPVSPKISQRILPLQFNMKIHEEEKEFLDCIESIFNFLNTKNLSFMTPNANKIHTMDLLIPCEESKFPVNVYKLIQRKKNKFLCNDAIENIYNQTWKNKNIMQGNSLIDIFANWKFDKNISTQTNYKNVLENIENEQPQCYICFENAPTKFSVCGHGFCMECWEEYKKTESSLHSDINGHSFITCPICRKELCEYDWIQIGSSDIQIQNIIPSKFEKLKIQIESQQDTYKKVFIIVPKNNKNIFINYLQTIITEFEFVEFQDFFSIENNIEKWICIEEENFAFPSLEIPMDIVYYLSPTLQSFKLCYPFLLRQVLKKEFLMVMFSISNHSQEENQLLSILENFFSF